MQKNVQRPFQKIESTIVKIGLSALIFINPFSLLKTIAKGAGATGTGAWLAISYLEHCYRTSASIGKKKQATCSVES